MTDSYFDHLCICDNDFEVLAELAAMALPSLDRTEFVRSLEANSSNLPALLSSSFTSLRSNNHIGERGAVFFKYIHILLQRIFKAQIRDRDIINSMSDLNRYLLAKMPSLSQEQLLIFLLDSKNHLIREEIIGHGITNRVFFHPQTIIKKILDVSASAFILVHNHTSGDPQPSPDDIAETLELVAICKKLSIYFHDHIIVGKDRVISMRGSGIF